MKTRNLNLIPWRRETQGDSQRVVEVVGVTGQEDELDSCTPYVEGNMGIMETRGGIGIRFYKEYKPSCFVTEASH